MKIKWLTSDDIVGVGIEWEIQFARFHTVKSMRHPDGTRRDTLVMYLSCTKEQLEKILHDNPKDCIPTNLLGLEVFPLYPNAVFWTWRYPGCKDEEFTRFEIIE